jgi:phage baseplate assembly protein V
MDRDELVEQRDALRRLENIAFYGTIEESDYTKARLRVKFADGVSAWLPWLERRAHDDSTWFAPEKGEQVLVVSPSGNPALGVIVGSIFQTKYPAKETTEQKASLTFSDDTKLSYDKQAHKIIIDISQQGGIEINVTGNGKESYSTTYGVSAGASMSFSAPTISINCDGAANISGESVTVSGSTIVLDASTVTVTGRLIGG